MRLAPRVIVLLLAAAAACSGRERFAVRPPRDAGSAALELFVLARSEAPGAEDLRALLDPGLATRDPGALAAALLPLRGAGSPRVVSTEALSGNGVTAVDFAADLPGGGTILGSVHARRLDDGTFRILWIATPGGSWPRLDGASREGLSTSGHGR